MIETRRSKNVVIFIQKILSFVLSRKIVNIYNDVARQYGNINVYLYIYIYISILGLAFMVPFLFRFQKLQLCIIKKFWNSFCCIVLICYELKSVSQIFKILLHTGNVNIFFLLGVFFSTYFQLKKSFSS